MKNFKNVPSNFEIRYQYNFYEFPSQVFLLAQTIGSFLTGQNDDEIARKTISVELQILATNREAAEKLPQHLKYSQKWLTDILGIYQACGAQPFQAIKVRRAIYES